MQITVQQQPLGPNLGGPLKPNPESEKPKKRSKSKAVPERRSLGLRKKKAAPVEEPGNTATGLGDLLPEEETTEEEAAYQEAGAEQYEQEDAPSAEAEVPEEAPYVPPQVVDEVDEPVDIAIPGAAPHEVAEVVNPADGAPEDGTEGSGQEELLPEEPSAEPVGAAVAEIEEPVGVMPEQPSGRRGLRLSGKKKVQPTQVEGDAPVASKGGDTLDAHFGKKAASKDRKHKKKGKQKDENPEFDDGYELVEFEYDYNAGVPGFIVLSLLGVIVCVAAAYFAAAFLL